MLLIIFIVGILVSYAHQDCSQDIVLHETEEDLRRRLTPIQYSVTQQSGTERPFTNEFWEHMEPGQYNWIIWGSPLFSSLSKFHTTCGWPGFSEPLGGVSEFRDETHGMVRTEVRCGSCGAHLGHVFPDGPPPTNQRYCINSASLTFVPE